MMQSCHSACASAAARCGFGACKSPNPAYRHGILRESWDRPGDARFARARGLSGPFAMRPAGGP